MVLALRRWNEASRAVVARRVPAREARDRDPRTRVRGVDEAAAADIEADVADAVEEDEVAGLQRAARHAPAEVELRVGAVGQLDAEVFVDEAHEARAIEAGARRAAAVAVGNAEQVPGVTDGV